MGARAKVRGLELQPGSPQLTLDSQLLAPQIPLGGLHLPQPEVGSQVSRPGTEARLQCRTLATRPGGPVASFKTLGHMLCGKKFQQRWKVVRQVNCLLVVGESGNVRVDRHAGRLRRSCTLRVVEITYVGRFWVPSGQPSCLV